jgi:hypothetical protein
MPKILTLAGLVVAALLLVLFGLDLAVGIPFSKANLTMDVAFVLAGALLGYSSWSTLRELT